MVALKEKLNEISEQMDALSAEDIIFLEEQAEEQAAKGVHNFGETKRRYLVSKYKMALRALQVQVQNSSLPAEIKKDIATLKPEKLDDNFTLIKKLLKSETHEMPQPKKDLSLARIPPDVRDEVQADYREMEKCLEAGCLRSVVILCGRILEVCLHAKYYQITGFDILEKNPGIGLGKLIAKMDEKGITLSPGLPQQIHLINNVRIFSVHKKQRVFYPSKEQTEAIILLTMDCVNHLF